MVLRSTLGMKWSTPLAFLILSFLELKGSYGTEPVPCPQAESNAPEPSPVNVDQFPGCPPSIATLPSTLCSPATVGALPPAALVSVVNALSAVPQTCGTLPPAALTALLGAVSASPCALKELSPVAVLVLLSAASSSISEVPPAVLLPLIRTLSESGLLQPSGSPVSGCAPLKSPPPPATVYAQLPPLPAPTPLVIAPGPSPGPIYINLPRKLPKPPPIVVPSGPPPSIVVSIPQPPPPAPLIMPYGKPGPIVVSDEQNAPPAPIVVPAPPPPNIYFTTHPSKSGNKCSQSYCGQPQPFEMPRVYALPPGVSPSQYFQTPKK